MCKNKIARMDLTFSSGLCYNQSNAVNGRVSAPPFPVREKMPEAASIFGKAAPKFTRERRR